MASVPLLPAKATEGAGAWLLLRRCTVDAVVSLVSAKARGEGAGAWLLLRRQCCTIAAVVPLVPTKATEGARVWLLLWRQCCTIAAVVPLVPAKTREGAGAWLLLRPQRCTVAAVVHLPPAKTGEGAGGWLLLRRQYCTVAAAVVSHERFRTITMTSASVLLYKHRLQKKSFVLFCRSTNQCTNLDYLVQCVFSRKGPVRLPQHLQYINRSSSPIRSLSLLRSTWLSTAHSTVFISCCTAKTCKPSTPKRYRVSGARTSDHKLTLSF